MAFLRSVDIQRADPYIQQAVKALTASGIKAALFYTHGQAGDHEFPGDRIRLDEGVTPRELADRVARWGADAAVSISLPCENALRDAAAKAYLDARGIPTVMTPLASTMSLVDKWETKQLLKNAGLEVPRAFRVDSDLLAGRGLPVPGYRDALRVQAEQVGFPLLSKPVWDSTSFGIQPLAGPTDLDRYLADPPEVSTVVEEVVHGDLCSVDIVGRPGAYQVLPVCWTGRAGTEPVFTFEDLRWCGPRPEADARFEDVARKLVHLCDRLGVCGSVNVDMIYTGDRFVVLEINPRIGGATTLSCAASGTNTFITLTDMARGLAPTDRPASRVGWAIEFLVPERIPEPVAAELGERLDVVTAHELVIDGTSHGDIVVFGLPEGDEAQTVKIFEELHKTTGFPSEGVLGKICSLLAP